MKNETEFANQDLDLDLFYHWVSRLSWHCYRELRKTKNTARRCALNSLECDCQLAMDMVAFWKQRHNEKFLTDGSKYSESTRMKAQIVRDFTKEDGKGFEDDE